MDIPDDALYLRVSHDPTGEGLGVARQEQDGRKLADARRVRVLAVFSDNDISASGKKNRPDFEKLLTAIESGAVEVVIAWDMTRLTRNARDFLRIAAGAIRIGTDIHATGDLGDSSPPSRKKRFVCPARRT